MGKKENSMNIGRNRSFIRQKKFALIGLGFWGKNIFRNLYGLGVLRTACDNNPKIIEKFKARYPDVGYTNSFESILNNPQIKAILIATPASTHFTLTRQALLAGKDVFVEKPLSLTVKEGQILLNLNKKTRRVLMVGHILQYHPAIIKLKKMISSGKLGKIYYIYSNRLNIGKLRTEESSLWSFAPHDISVILMLLEEEPDIVYAFGGDYLNRGINDVTLTHLEFKNGLKSHIFVSWLHPFKEQKLVVVGSKAMAVFDDLTEDKLFLYPHRIEWRYGKIPLAQKAHFKVIAVEKKEPLREELEHFVHCVHTRKNPKTDCAEGLMVLKVLEAADKQSSTGRNASGPIRASKKFFIHETTCIDDNVRIGDGTKIWHFSHILKNSRIGSNCIIGQNVSIGPDVVIGNRCKIQNNVSVYKGVILEDGVFCGPSCVFTNVYNPRAFVERKDKFKQTLVKEGATIGANATVVCGVTIGSYALVGAGAVVKKNVADYALVVGVPARQIGWVCRCGTTLKRFTKNILVCGSCANKYKLQNNNIAPVI